MGSTVDHVAAVPGRVGSHVCRVCLGPLAHDLVDLGASPLCERFLAEDELDAMEPTFPLHVRMCTACKLGQLPSFVSPDVIFREYAYFSAYSTSWVEHARAYVETMVELLQLGRDSLVVEIASNDGYLLQHFLPHGVPVLGVDPALNVAEAARARGVPTVTDFFGVDVARSIVAEHGEADLVVGNNVLAQVPDLHDLLEGVGELLAPHGRATFEFPHLTRLIEGLQYDTIYHEHFSYFSLASIVKAATAHGLEVVDVDELPTHGGSLRVHCAHVDAGVEPTSAVDRILSEEDLAGLGDPARYRRFADDVRSSKRALLRLLVEMREAGKQVAGYGAPGKGTTLLNYCGIGPDLLDYTVDRNEHKHGMYTPGMRIPIHPVERLAETRPDVILILPWNLVVEISAQLSRIVDWDAQLAVPIPFATLFEPGSTPVA